MIQTERNREKTDQAWNRLYERLGSDHLIPLKKERSILRPAFVKWGATAAAVIVLSVYLSVSVFSTKGSPTDTHLLTEQNMEESMLVTTLEDGSIVYLAQETSLQYPAHFSQEKREVSLHGNALFDIAGNRERPFLIETGKVLVEVIGTAFNVKTNGKRSFELSVQRGKVKVTLKDNGQNMYVKAGETVSLLSHKLELCNTPNMEQFSDYTRNIRFKDASLADILRVINLREPEIQIQASPELGERKLTVSFSNDSPETIVQLICMALNVKYSLEKNVFILFE